MRWPVPLVLAFTLYAQNPRFGVQSRLVLVPVTVTDAKGRAVNGLEANDFVVLDNGRPQKATVDTLCHLPASSQAESFTREDRGRQTKVRESLI
jgi:hypothetical protein